VVGSSRPTTVGYLGKNHRIHVAVNNFQDEHQSIVLKMPGTIVDQNFIILIDLGATERFISSAMLKRIKVKATKHDEFRYIELAPGVKQKVGGKVT